MAFFSRKALIENFKALHLSPSALEAAIDRNDTSVGWLATGPGPYGQPNVLVSQAVVELQHAQYGWIYRSVPAARAVIDKIALNVSQLSLRLYEEGADYATEEVRDHPALHSVQHPSPQTPEQTWIRQVMTAYLIYNDAFVVKFPRPNDEFDLHPVPTEFMGVMGPTFFKVSGYRLWHRDGTYDDIPPERVIHWRGVNPLDPRNGISPLETLRKVLAEDAASLSASTELYKAGLAPPGYLARPDGAPQLDGKDAQRVVERWRQAQKNPGRETALLEEGMTYNPFGVSPKDAEQLSGRRFSIEETCRAYGVPLSVMGVNTQTVDVEQEHLQFYQDVLIPLCEFLCSFLDLSLLRQEYDAESLCFMFDTTEKLRGDPATRYSLLTSATGRPWKTVNEVRNDEDLPPVPGGDELFVPSNGVLVDGEGNPMTPSLPAPNVMPPQNPMGPPQDGSHRNPPGEAMPTNGNGKADHLIPRRQRADDRRDGWARKHEAILLGYWSRPEGKADGSSLASLLHKLGKQQVEAEGRTAAFRMASEFDPSQVKNYLAAKAKNVAAELDAQTAKDIEELGRDAALERARNVRAPGTAMKLASDNAAFAVKAAIQQTQDAPQRMVTITGGDCEICADYQGTWRIGDLSDWPGYHANCNCIADIS